MVYINEIGVYLPHDPVTNEQIENVLGHVPGSAAKSRRIVLKSNGIETRHYAIDPSTGTATHTNAQLAAQATRNVLKQSGLKSPIVDLLACGTSSTDQLSPSHAVMVHGELGLPPCEVVSIAGVCCSGVGALKYAYLSLKENPEQLAIVTGSEITSKYLRARNFLNSKEPGSDVLETDLKLGFDQHFLRWMLSDGAAAVLVQGRPKASGLSLRIDWIDSLSYANEQAACMYAGALKKPDGSTESWLDYDRNLLGSMGIMNLAQDVRQLNGSIVEYMLSKPFPEIIAKRKLRSENIDYFVPHYSSEYFRPKLYEGLRQLDFELPYEKWFTNLTVRGNVGSASVFLSLEGLMTSGKLKAGDRVLCLVPESARFSISYFHLTVVSS